jgi:hypothetical protein
LLTVKVFPQIPQNEQTHLPKSSYKTLRNIALHNAGILFSNVRGRRCWVWYCCFWQGCEIPTRYIWALEGAWDGCAVVLFSLRLWCPLTSLTMSVSFRKPSGLNFCICGGFRVRYPAIEKPEIDSLFSPWVWQVVSYGMPPLCNLTERTAWWDCGRRRVFCLRLMLL